MAKLRKNSFTDKKEVNRLAVPAIIASTSEPIISFIDNAIIANSSNGDSTSLGAVALGSSFFLSLIWVFSQTRTAMSTIMARYFGAKKINDVKSLVPQAIVMNFLLGVFIYFLTNTFISLIFSMQNATGELLEETISYFSIRSIGFPIALATLMMFGIFRGIQNTLWAMIITLIGAGLNIILDLLFLNGYEGIIEPMGVRGVALASLISQVVMFLLSFWVLFKKTPFRFKLEFMLHPEVFTLLKMALNLVVRSIAVNTCYLVSSSVSASYGEDYIAVQGIFMNIWLFSAFFVEGYCIAGNALAGKYYGEGNMDKLSVLSKYMLRNSVLLGVYLALFCFATYWFIGQLFLETDSTLTIFYSTFWLVILVMPLNAYAFTYDELLKGIGSVRYIRNTIILATTTGFIPTIFLFHYMGFKLHSVWIAFCVWMIFRGTRLMRYFNVTYGQKTAG